MEGIKQFFWCGGFTLYDLYVTLIVTQAIIFCHTKRKVEWFTENMHCNNSTVSSMHVDMPQKESDAIMTKIRVGRTSVVITTDIWACGLVVQQLQWLCYIQDFVAGSRLVLGIFSSTDWTALIFTPQFL